MCLEEENENPDAVRVAFIDFGNQDTVLKSEIALASKFDRRLLRIPPQVFVVHMSNVAKMEGDEFLNAFDPLVPIKIQVRTRPESPFGLIEAELFQEIGGEMVNVNEQVLASNYATSLITLSK
jgi:hypothetical protein